MGKIAKIISDTKNMLFRIHYLYQNHERTDMEMINEMDKEIKHCEIEILDEIEKCVPEDFTGNVPLYRIGFHDCRMKVKRELNYLRGEE